MTYRDSRRLPGIPPDYAIIESHDIWSVVDDMKLAGRWRIIPMLEDATLKLVLQLEGQPRPRLGPRPEYPRYARSARDKLARRVFAEWSNQHDLQMKVSMLERPRLIQRSMQTYHECLVQCADDEVARTVSDICDDCKGVCERVFDDRDRYHDEFMRRMESYFHSPQYARDRMFFHRGSQNR